MDYWFVDSMCVCQAANCTHVYLSSDSRTIERENERGGGGYACVHKPNVAAMVPMCILISTVFCLHRSALMHAKDSIEPGCSLISPFIPRPSHLLPALSYLFHEDRVVARKFIEAVKIHSSTFPFSSIEN